jgi:VWFA-related protein
MLTGAAAMVLRAQDEEVIRSEVKVVNVLTNVRDAKGRVMPDLEVDDFTLKDNGKPQKIQYFARQSDLPLTLGLLIDTSNSQRAVLSEERDGSRQFIQQVLREEKDLSFLIRFDQDVELLADLTGSKAKLSEALNDAVLPAERRQRNNLVRYQFPGGRQRFPGGGQGRGQGGGAQRQNAGTVLFDAVLLASEEMLRKREGRKALILLSDGMDFGSKTSQTRAIEAAQRAEAILYAVRYADPRIAQALRRRPLARLSIPDGKKVLESMCAATGGVSYELEPGKLNEVFQQIEEDLRNQYSLGFTPDPPAKPGEFRKLELRVKFKGATARTREGYFGA